MIYSLAAVFMLATTSAAQVSADSSDCSLTGECAAKPVSLVQTKTLNQRQVIEDPEDDDVQTSSYLELLHEELSVYTQGLLRDELMMLSPDQLVMLHQIQQGHVDKSQIEVVLAQYDEDIGWSDAYANIRTVYCKGNEHQAPSGCLPLPNIGREGQTYLHHIVTNYDKLADWTVFSQAGEPSLGYKGHRLGGGHMLPGISFHDYVLRNAKSSLAEHDGSMFVFTSAISLNTTDISVRTSYADQESMTQSGSHQTRCPQKEHLDGWEPFLDLDWFGSHVAERCGIDESSLAPLLMQYWERHVEAPLPPDNLAFYAQGARFAVSRARIQERPKMFYERLLKATDGDIDPCANYLNEWLWYYLIGKPGTPACETHELLDLQSMKEDSVWGKWEKKKSFWGKRKGKKPPVSGSRLWGKFRKKMGKKPPVSGSMLWEKFGKKMSKKPPVSGSMLWGKFGKKKSFWGKKTGKKPPVSGSMLWGKKQDGKWSKPPVSGWMKKKGDTWNKKGKKVTKLWG